MALRRKVAGDNRTAVGAVIDRDVSGNGTGIVNALTDHLVLRNRTVCTHSDRRSFGTERSAARDLALFDIDRTEVERAVVGRGHIGSVTHCNMQRVAGRRFAFVNIQCAAVDREIVKLGCRVGCLVNRAARKRHVADTGQHSRVFDRAGCKRKAVFITKRQVACVVD